MILSSGPALDEVASDHHDPPLVDLLVIASPSGHPADLFATAVEGVGRSYLLIGVYCLFLFVAVLAWL